MITNLRNLTRFQPESIEAPTINAKYWKLSSFCVNPKNQLMVNRWFEARWFGILGVPLRNNPVHKRDARNPNHQPKPTNEGDLEI